MKEIRELASVLEGDRAPFPAVQIRQAVVSQASPLQIKLGASVTAISAKRWTGYSPALNDVVLVIQFGPDLIVLGTYA